MTARGIVWLCLVFAPLALAGPAAAESKPMPPGAYTGSLTGSYVYYDTRDAFSRKITWRGTGLKLKRGRSSVVGRQQQAHYKVVKGSVTWTYQESGRCAGPPGMFAVDFTETFSLRGIRWDEDSRITLFADRKARKKRWRVAGSLFVRRERMADPCHTGMPATYTLPQLVAGTRVHEKPPIARPGKPVRLSFHSRETTDPAVWLIETKTSLTLRPR